MNQTKKTIKVKKTIKIKKSTPTTPPPPPYESDTEVCPPVNKKTQRTFVNLGIDPKTAERFKVNDTCDRCGHFFKRGMIKEYHYASKNCSNQKPYSETEKGQTGKGGEHTARKAKTGTRSTITLWISLGSWGGLLRTLTTPSEFFRRGVGVRILLGCWGRLVILSWILSRQRLR